MVTATYGHYDQHAAKIGLGCINWIRLPASDSVPFFQRRPGSDCEKPARIRSGHILAKIFWSGRKSVCKNYRAKLWQNATGPLQVSQFETRLRSSTDGPDHIAQNQPGSDLIVADCVRLWPNGSGPEAC